MNWFAQELHPDGQPSGRRLLKQLFLVAVVTSYITGCTPSKLVSISSEPSRAEVEISSVRSGYTTVQKKVEFPEKRDVLLTLRLQGYERLDTTIAFYPKELTDYNFNLVRKVDKDVPLVDFKPLQTNRGVRLQSVRLITTAYIETIERSPNVKSVTRVTDFRDSLIQVGNPCVSPEGDAVVYSIYEFEYLDPKNGFSNIYLRKIGAASQTKITFGSRLDLFPAYSPDGGYIYFSSNRISDNPTIWRIMESGGGGLTAITSGDTEDFAPSAFNDGKMIAYTSLLPGTTEPQIWTIRISGTLPTQLREGEFGNAGITSDELVFVRADRNTITRRGDETFNPLQIWTMTKEGGAETQMTQNTEYNCIQPQWSPDGEWIAFVSDEGKDTKGRNNYDIWMMKKDGTRKTQLTTNGSWDDSPYWSPDGKKIYFRSNRGGAWNIWYFEPVMLNDGLK